MRIWLFTCMKSLLFYRLMGAMFISLGTNMYDYYNPHGDTVVSFWEGFVEPSVIFFILVRVQLLM